MLACPSCLNLMVQFIDVISNRQQDTLGGDICFSTIQIPSELHILFDVRKAAFRLATVTALVLLKKRTYLSLLS